MRVRSSRLADTATGTNSMVRRPWRGRALVVLLGPPGSGKSTYAARYPYVVTTDVLRAMPRGSLPARAIETVYERAFESVIAHLKANHTVVLDSMGINKVVRRRALSVARAYRASPTLVIFTTAADVCVAHQETRSHPVPAAIVRRLHGEAAALHDEVRLEGWASVVEHAIP